MSKNDGRNHLLVVTRLLFATCVYFFNCFYSKSDTMNVSSSCMPSSLDGVRASWPDDDERERSSSPLLRPMSTLSGVIPSLVFCSDSFLGSSSSQTCAFHASQQRARRRHATFQTTFQTRQIRFQTRQIRRRQNCRCQRPRLTLFVGACVLRAPPAAAKRQWWTSW